MAGGEIGGRTPVAGPLGEPRPQRGAGLVAHGGGRLVAHPQPALVEPPHQVDVLAAAQVVVETAGGQEHVGPGHEGRRRHVGDPGAGPDARLARSEVEWRAHRLVPGQRRPAVRRRAGDARGDRRHAVVGELQQQRLQPSRLGMAIGVDERHDRRRHRRQTEVAGCRRSAIGRAPQHGGPWRHDRGVGAVVDDQHLVLRGQFRHQFAHRTVLHRDHDRDVLDAIRTAVGPRMDGTGVEEALGQLLGTGRHGFAGDQPAQHLGALLGEPEERQR